VTRFIIPFQVLVKDLHGSVCSTRKVTCLIFSKVVS